MNDPNFSVGEVYAFRTRSTTAYGPAETGRCAAFKIIGANAQLFCVAVLEGVWGSAPTLENVRNAKVLCERRFAKEGRAATFGVLPDLARPDDLLDLACIGAAPVSAEEAALAARILRGEIGTVRSALVSANAAAEGEWRWAHDRAAYTAEVERQQADQQARWAAEEERLRTRLRGLTVDKLLAETPFERWAIPPPEFTDAAREAIHGACRRIREMGPKPRKAEVRKVLRDCVEWFSRADQDGGGVIETDEREDICAALEEIAHAARQPSLYREIERWREW